MKLLLQLHSYRYATLILVFIIGGFLLPGVKKAIEIDNSLKVWFLENDPALVNYQKFQERFGNDEVIIFMMHDPDGLINEKQLLQIREVTRAIAALPEVKNIVGAGNITILKNDITGFYPVQLMDGNFNPEEITNQLDKISIIREQIFTDNYQTARFIITLKSLKDFDVRRAEIIDKVQTTVNNHIDPAQTFFGGIGVIYAGLNRLSSKDFGFFMSLGYLAMFIIIFITYRKWQVLVYTLGTVALATYFTLGIYGLLGHQLNLMTTLLPLIFVLLGIMNIIHILNEQSLLSSGGSLQKQVALLSLQRMFMPGFFNTLTTMAGFLSLLTSPMAILQNFGLFSAIGILLCFIFSYLLGVIILPVTSISPKISFKLGNQLSAVLLHIIAKKKLYSGISLFIVMLSITGIFLLKSDTYTLGYFPKTNKVVQDHNQMERLWGPYIPLDFLVEPNNGIELHSRAMVKATNDFSDRLKNSTDIGSAFGFNSLYMASLQQLNPEKYTLYIKSESALRKADVELKRLYPELYEQYIHEATNTGRLIVFGKMATSKELTRKLDSINVLAKQSPGLYANVHASGYQPLYAGITQYATSSQVSSLFTASIFIFLLIWLFIKNLKLALLAIISNFFPVIVMLGFMGLAGINLDIATASIAAIVLSICVDDTVHYIFYYRKLREKGSSPSFARLQTTRHIGPAILITSLILFCGFAFMMLGQLQTVKLFGLLTALAIFTGLFGEVVLFPLMLEKFDRTRKNEDKLN